MRVFKNQEEIQRVLNEILDQLDKWRSKDWDFHGLRIRNASPSQSDSDYVTRGELKAVQGEIPNPSKGFTGKITTAKLTGGGSNGYMVFRDGVLIEQKQPT